MGNSAIDLIIRIKNGYMSRREQVEIINSKMSIEILKKLKELGFIAKYEVKERKIVTDLIYKDKLPALREVKLFSKPGRRHYTSYKELKLIKGGLGYSLISTSQGILSNYEAREKKIGGELLFSIS